MVDLLSCPLDEILDGFLAFAQEPYFDACQPISHWYAFGRRCRMRRVP
jgi:hypothetical protein